MSRYQRRNPDFRNTGFRNPVQSPPVLLLETPIQSGGETLILGTVLSRFGRIESGTGTPEVARAEIYGYIAGDALTVACLEIEDLGDVAEGRRFRMHFDGGLQIARGFTLSIPGDWKPLRSAIGQFPAGILTNESGLATLPQGRLLFTHASDGPPGSFPSMAIASITAFSADTVEITFENNGGGDLIKSAGWQLFKNGAELPSNITETGPLTIRVEYGSPVSSGDLLTAVPALPEVTTTAGWYAPGVYYQMP